MTTEAALKAWDTRRRMGWVHPNARDIVEAKPKRRAGKARMAMLRERALKAWETRRANAEAVAQAAARAVRLRAKKRRARATRG